MTPEIDEISLRYQPGITVEDAFLVRWYTHPTRRENDDYWSMRGIAREDSALIQVIEEFGREASGRHAELEIVEIPDGVDYEIDDYDGMESIHEKHRSWG